MFDWPLHSQTSPTSTSLIETVFPPVMVSVCGVALAASGWSRTIHLPSLAMVETCCPAKATVIFSPSLAVPQTGTSIFCCKTT